MVHPHVYIYKFCTAATHDTEYICHRLLVVLSTTVLLKHVPLKVKLKADVF